jgi:hypothetical protein
MTTGQKHLVSCRCVLPQFKKLIDPPAHKFIVFSIINDDDQVKPKFSQCTNCGIIHRVTEIGKSEIIQGREAMGSIMTIQDIKTSLPEQLITILELNNVDLPTWEAAQFILENKQWGDFVVLTSDVEDGLKQGKYVRILGEKLFKVEAYSREEIVK